MKGLKTLTCKDDSDQGDGWCQAGRRASRGHHLIGGVGHLCDLNYVLKSCLGPCGKVQLMRLRVHRCSVNWLGPICTVQKGMAGSAVGGASNHTRGLKVGAQTKARPHSSHRG
jgi:hypothetical protein